MSTSGLSEGHTIPLQPEMTSQPAWQIRGTSGYFKGRVIPVKGVMLVGRNPQAQISYPVDTKGISGNHCQLIEEGGYISLADLESSYGTYLGQGIRLEAGIQYRLEEGDVFYLANPNHSFCLERVK